MTSWSLLGTSIPHAALQYSISIISISLKWLIYLQRIIRHLKLGTVGGRGCGRQESSIPLTRIATKQHEAARRVPTDMILSARVEVVRSGPGSIAECGAGVRCWRDMSSTGSEAGLGVAVPSFRQRGQSAECAVSEDNLYRCYTSTSTTASRDDYSLCRE